MIRTLLVAPEYVVSAKSAGVYAHMLGYIAKVDAGQQPSVLPGEMAMNTVVQPQQRQIMAHTPQQQLKPQAAVMKGRRNEKALNYFQSCLQVLGLEEEVALTEDLLKKA